MFSGSFFSFMKTRKKYYAEIVSNDSFNWQLSVKHFKEIVSRYKLLQDSTFDTFRIHIESGYYGIKVFFNENEYIICFNSKIIHYNNKIISIKLDECRSLEKFIVSTIPDEASKHILKKFILI